MVSWPINSPLLNLVSSFGIYFIFLLILTGGHRKKFVESISERKNNVVFFHAVLLIFHHWLFCDARPSALVWNRANGVLSQSSVLPVDPATPPDSAPGPPLTADPVNSSRMRLRGPCGDSGSDEKTRPPKTIQSRDLDGGIFGWSRSLFLKRIGGSVCHGTN